MYAFAGRPLSTRSTFGWAGVSRAKEALTSPLVTRRGAKERRVRTGRAFQNTDTTADLTGAFGQ